MKHVLAIDDETKQGRFGDGSDYGYIPISHISKKVFTVKATYRYKIKTFL